MATAETLGYLLYHISSVMYRQSDQALQERLGIGMSQFKLLVILRQQPNIQQRTLADQLGQTEASISRQVKLLRGKGMLVIQVNPKNRREHITTLTAKGIKLEEAAREVLKEYYDPVLGHLSSRQQQQLQETFIAIHELICPVGKSHVYDPTINA
jgi:DNA-binding MarR family transcriptional regulator